MAVHLCPHCGTVNRGGSFFCSRCGTDLRTEEDAPPAEPGFEEETGVGFTARDVPASEPPWLSAGPPDEEALLAVEPFALEFPGDRPAAVEWPAGMDPALAGLPRLLAGVQGLLEPIGVSVTGERAPSTVTAVAAAPMEQLRRIRSLMSEEPQMVRSASNGRRRRGGLWLPWAHWLLAAAVALPIFLGFTRPAGEPQEWSGVADGWYAVDGLAPASPVLILWAYDPAAAGELDTLALPVLRHLLERQAQLEIVTLLPNGAAAARRMVKTAQLAANTSAAVPIRFLSGGVAALGLLAQNRTAATWQARSQTVAAPLPQLAIVFAAQSEDVQQWLEQISPALMAPVVAVTAAAADPGLRPYWQSGQLAGLVSGFDGAYHYARRNDDTGTRAQEQISLQLLVAQNSGTLAILLCVALGNLLLLFGRRSDG
jgi:hypothetical protein